MTATELLMSKDFEGQNRGFGFVEFYNHGAANAAKKTLSSPTFKYCPAVRPLFNPKQACQQLQHSVRCSRPNIEGRLVCWLTYLGGWQDGRAAAERGICRAQAERPGCLWAGPIQGGLCGWLA